MLENNKYPGVHVYEGLTGPTLRYLHLKMFKIHHIIVSSLFCNSSFSFSHFRPCCVLKSDYWISKTYENIKKLNSKYFENGMVLCHLKNSEVEEFKAFCVIYDRKLNIFGLWAPDRTKQDIGRCQLELHEHFSSLSDEIIFLRKYWLGLIDNE